MMKTRIIGSVLFVLLLCSASSAQVFIEEGKVKLSVNPGENKQGNVVLHNTTDQNVTMNVYWEDFSYKPPYDGSKEFSGMGTTEHSLTDWVNVNSSKLSFGPFAKRTVSYTVNVPDEIREGHYGVLFFENADKQYDMAKGMNIVTRIGCLFFVEPQYKLKTVEMSDYGLSAQGLTMTFTNQGNVIVIPDGTFYVIDAEGQVFDRGSMDKIYLPPGKDAQYSLAFNRELGPGDYTLVMTISLEDDDVVVREVDFEVQIPSNYTVKSIRD